MGFKTILQSSHHQITVQKSRFICHLFPVKSAEEAEEAIASVCKEHYKATHNVPAYIAGEEYKYSDDGEPAGTAGAPLLSMLKHEGYDYLCAVVTRYFGGIKLGTGGLVRAYTSALKEALSEADIVTVGQYDRTEIEMDYTYLGSVEHYLKSLTEEGGTAGGKTRGSTAETGKTVHISDKKYLDKVTISLFSSRDLTQRMLEEMTEITAASLKITRHAPLLLTDHFEVFEL